MDLASPIICAVAEFVCVKSGAGVFSLRFVSSAPVALHAQFRVVPVTQLSIELPSLSQLYECTYPFSHPLIFSVKASTDRFVMKLVAYVVDLKERLVRYGGLCLPSVGGISLLSLSTTIMEKQFLRNSLGELQVVAKDVLWWYSHVGVGVWIYQRKHLDSTRPLSR